MTQIQSTALQIAKEITIAALQATGHRTDADSGATHAAYFEAIYNKVISLASDGKEN